MHQQGRIPQALCQVKEERRQRLLSDFITWRSRGGQTMEKEIRSVVCRAGVGEGVKFKGA